MLGGLHGGKGDRACPIQEVLRTVATNGIGLMATPPACPARCSSWVLLAVAILLAVAAMPKRRQGYRAFSLPSIVAAPRTCLCAAVGADRPQPKTASPNFEATGAGASCTSPHTTSRRECCLAAYPGRHRRTQRCYRICSRICSPATRPLVLAAACPAKPRLPACPACPPARLPACPPAGR